MAGVKSTAVFTNDISSCDTSDLLQQAFQDVVDTDNNDTEFITYLQDDTDEIQEEAIHLTQEQASELGLTFEIDNSNIIDDIDDNNDSSYNQDQNVTLEDIERVTQIFDNQTLINNNKQFELQFNNNDKQWNEDNDDDCGIEECLDDNIMHVESLDIPQDDMDIIQFDNLKNNDNYTAIFNNEEKNNLPSNYNEFLSETYSTNGNSNFVPRETMFQQKFTPVLPESSSYIIKPIQTLLKNTKGIRRVVNGNDNNKIITENNSVGCVNPNSLLLQRNSVYNGVNTQIVKNNSTPGQLFDSSRSSWVNNFTNGTIKTTTQPATNKLRNNYVKTSEIETNNQQQYVNKNTSLHLNVKNQISSNRNLLPVSFLKTVNNLPGLSKNSCTIKNSTESLSPKFISSFLQTDELNLRLKNQNYDKTIATSIGTMIRTTNHSTPPVSILKPQKVTLVNSNKQNIKNSVNSFVKKVGISQSTQPAATTTTTTTSTTTITNPIDEKKIVNNVGSNLNNKSPGEDVSVGKVLKKQKLSGLQNSDGNGTRSDADASQPLGSSENPIHIVQQGQSFHSMQKLTQSQLKQIAHVLQQRSQESSASNEKVVYRVVFPEELDLRIRNPGNVIKGRGGKRGRPKKVIGRHPVSASKPTTLVEEEIDESKDDRKKIVARTRSGRLSRPPRHMVRDYKHLHHLDFTEPDMDDSDGGYSDYNTSNDIPEDDTTSKELLAGLEVPKRKIADHFRCLTCNKIYLGRTRMAKHYEIHPDHGSPDQLPQKTSTPPSSTTTTTTAVAATTESPQLKNLNGLPSDPFKRKGKKRGPWAYVTPEAKSERRQLKLQEAMSVCDNNEIIKIAAMPVLNAKSLFDLIAIKSGNNVRSLLDELKILLDDVRGKAGLMLSPLNDDEQILSPLNCNDEQDRDIVDLRDELLCDTLGILPGIYTINDNAFKKQENSDNIETTMTNEPPLKSKKITNDECKENIEERMSSGFSESSDLSVSDFLNERKIDNNINTNCPEVLTALTLIRNPSPIIDNNCGRNDNSVSKLLISNPEIQDQISDNPGFQKIDINTTKNGNTTFRKIETIKDGFIKLSDGIDITDCSNVFTKIDDNNYHHHHHQSQKLDTIQQAFIKLEPMQQGFVKLENGTINTYRKNDLHNNFNRLENDYTQIVDNETHNFSNGFQKLIMNNKLSTNINVKNEKTNDELPILHDNNTIITTNCNSSIFGSSDNFDNLDILDNTSVIDGKLVDMHLVEQTNLVDELVSERLKNIMTDNLSVVNNLLPNDENVDTDLDFDAFSEEFNRNTNS